MAPATAAVHSWRILSAYRLPHALRVSICFTKDVVNHPPPATVLINPCNERLSGTHAFSYFPRGGPVPPTSPPGMERQSVNWGGMDAGENMLYPAQTVDGLVGIAGGPAQSAQLAAISKCPTGHAVSTAATGTLARHFERIVHTATPFYASPKWELQLRACYMHSLSIATKAAKSETTIATPILGAGCKGIPVEDAVGAAADACRAWDAANPGSRAHLIVAIQDPSLHTLLRAAFQTCGCDSS
ncbi:Aste57867_22995 [Aphanomyces stellatus]|uniref:Aste57867_22995 protein n=1 Tax=Aphanomyces stellatus TaxID=120398 RepID=A0A485LN54_9STRA|nr:hypothetical protein As57867_022924 [Aphanomyces stellatus]VFT99644.1 Aste57867_22995 [Aphanomyces stellatus]